MKNQTHFQLRDPLYVGLDIETAPACAYADLPESIRAYVDRKIERGQKTDPELDYTKFASLHPAFGRIVCLSVGRFHADDDGDTIITRSYSGGEGEILETFDRTFARFRPVFVHFNGINFDLPFILMRMRVAGITCSIPGFEDSGRGGGVAHRDVYEILSGRDRARSLSLVAAAHLAGVPAPKNDLDGAGVAATFAAGQIGRISRYCERDVATTLNIFRRLVLLRPVISPELCYWKDDSGYLRSIDFGGDSEDSPTFARVEIGQ